MADSIRVTVGARISSAMDKITRSTERANAALRTTQALTRYAAKQTGGSGATATEVSGATVQVEQFNQKQQQAQDGTRGILGKWKEAKESVQAATTIMGGAQKVLDLADTMAATSARLDLMNDGMQTTEELQNQILGSANRARAAYQTTADAVTKMGLAAGDAFGSNKELIAFTELANKQFVIAGTSASGMDTVMQRLTQTMASGVLRSEEFSDIFKQAPGIIETVAKYLDVPVATLREMAASGEITAATVKNAMLASADDINAKFEAMPMTWGQVWNRMSNTALVLLSPLLTGLSWLANNIDVMGPLLLGLGAAFAVFAIAANWIKIAEVATKAWTAVQGAFNAVMALNPVVLVVGAIIVLIGLIYAAVAVFNKFTGSTVSATGLIAGAVMWLAALIGNIVIGLFNGLIQLAWNIFVLPFIGVIEWVLNVVNGGFDSFGGAVANLIGNIISWFLSLGKVVTKIIDAIFGTDWTGGLTALQDNVLGWGKNETAITLDRNAPEIAHRFDMTDAFDMGYNFGQGVEDKVAGLFGFDGGDMDSIYDGVGETAVNTGKMAEEVNIADEDMVFLRDAAEMRFIQNFVTLTPTVAMNASISEKVDVGAVVGEIERRLEEEFSANAEGVYA